MLLWAHAARSRWRPPPKATAEGPTETRTIFKALLRDNEQPLACLCINYFYESGYVDFRDESGCVPAGLMGWSWPLALELLARRLSWSGRYRAWGR